MLLVTITFYNSRQEINNSQVIEKLIEPRGRRIEYEFIKQAKCVVKQVCRSFVRANK